MCVCVCERVWDGMSTKILVLASIHIKFCR